MKQHRHAAYQKVGVIKTYTTIHEDGGMMCPCEHKDYNLSIRSLVEMNLYVYGEIQVRLTSSRCLAQAAGVLHVPTAQCWKRACSSPIKKRADTLKQAMITSASHLLGEVCTKYSGTCIVLSCV